MLLYVGIFVKGSFFMESVKSTIVKNKLIKRGEIIGVGVSGGTDSMALLHYLHSISDELDFEICAVHIDHNIRENSSDDATFVMNYCKENGIRAYKFRVDVPKLAAERGVSLEVAARDARFGVFDALVKKGAVDKIAIAHHMSDQAETILLNLFRGTGIAGTRGMDLIRDGIYIRPMLFTEKKEILDYINYNSIPYVEDYTNADTTYSRNYIRNEILPVVCKRWPGAIEKIVSFSKACYDDDEYINSQIIDDAFILEEKTVKIPNSYFLYPNAIISRMIFKALRQIGITKDIERKHVELIKDLAINGKNGSKIDLPFGASAFKEYDYLTIINKNREVIVLNNPFKIDEFFVKNFGNIIVKRTKSQALNSKELILDSKKVPKDAIWRFRENGDVFEKFGGGTKKLKDYFIDKKVPQRLRSTTPVLASGNEILAIAGIEVSDKVKVDESTTSIYKICVEE